MIKIMNVNPIKLKNYANYNGFMSILKTQPENSVGINLANLKPNLRELGVKMKRESKFGIIIGTALIKNRTTNSIERVNIRSLLDIKDDSFIVIESNGKELLNSALKSKQKSIRINVIEKMPKGANYSGVAKIIDRLAVITSKFNNKNGKVTLKTTCSYSLDGYSNAEPLHWARGYRRQTPPLNKIKYEELMKSALNNYKKARAAGKKIEEAKQSMDMAPLPSVKMELSDEKVKEYLKGTPLLELF